MTFLHILSLKILIIIALSNDIVLKLLLQGACRKSVGFE